MGRGQHQREGGAGGEERDGLEGCGERVPELVDELGEEEGGEDERGVGEGDG